MENIKHNLNNSKPSINNDNQLNSIDKENFINYNGENISIISNSISEINFEAKTMNKAKKVYKIFSNMKIMIIIIMIMIFQ